MGKLILDAPYRNLWAAVLEQAVKDVLQCTASLDRERTLSWFESKRKDVGSFLWICNVLDLNPETIRMYIRLGMMKTFLSPVNALPLNLG